MILKKKICLLLVSFLVVTLLNACYLPSDAKRKISSQPNTKWVSEDGTIEFYVHENGEATGTIVVSGDTVEILLACNPYKNILIFPITKEDNPLAAEQWICSYKSMDKFVATVQWGEYSEAGQEIVFHKVR